MSQQTIDWIESLTEPDRTADAEIAIACGWHRLPPEHGTSAGHWVSPLDWKRKEAWEGWVSTPHLPRFTDSIDAALMLLPALDDTLRPLTIKMSVSENGKRFHAALSNWRWGQVGSSTRCASYAIALAAAALRARAQSLSPPEDQTP